MLPEAPSLAECVLFAIDPLLLVTVLEAEKPTSMQRHLDAMPSKLRQEVDSNTARVRDAAPPRSPADGIGG